MPIRCLSKRRHASFGADAAGAAFGREILGGAKLKSLDVPFKIALPSRHFAESEERACPTHFKLAFHGFGCCGEGWAGCTPI